MPQPPPQPAPTGFHSRAMTPVRNPVYLYNDNADFKTAHPAGTNVLERPAPTPPGVDSRLTSQGSLPPVHGLPGYVPYAAQTPYNIWDLFPA